MKKENNKKNIKVKQKKIKQKKTKKLPKKLPNDKSMKQKMNKKTTKKKIAKRKVKITKFGGSTSLFGNYNNNVNYDDNNVNYANNSKIRRIFLRTITNGNQAVFTIDPVILQNNGKNNEINNADKILDFYISLWKDFANYDTKDNKNNVFITEFDQLTPSIPFLDIYKYMKHHGFRNADKFGDLIGISRDDNNNYEMTDTNNTQYLEAFKLFIQSVYDKFYKYNINNKVYIQDDKNENDKIQSVVDALFNLEDYDDNYYAFNDYCIYLHIYVFNYLSVITSKNSNIKKDNFPYDTYYNFFLKIENRLRPESSTNDANNLEQITKIQTNNTANNDYEQNNIANNTDYDNKPPIMNITTDNNSPTDNKPAEPLS
jgi:hypothetical protein